VSKLEKVELFLIPVIGLLIWQFKQQSNLGLGRLVLYASALLLAQSLIRDISLLFASKPHNHEKIQKATCMCMESSIGMTGIIAGSLLVGLGFDAILSMKPMIWSLGVMLILIVGFLIKDIVIQLNPMRIYSDKNHMNIVFTWKK
jgi:hypothetical protein